MIPLEALRSEEGVNEIDGERHREEPSQGIIEIHGVSFP
jgi:hypothetical protein